MISQDDFDAMNARHICIAFKNDLNSARSSALKMEVARFFNMRANNWHRSHHTIKNLITSLRRVAQENEAHFVTDALVLNDSNLLQVKRRESQRMRERATGMIEFPNIESFERLVSDNRFMSASDSVLFALYVTGRRVSELRPHNFVGAYDGSPVRSCLFTGQAKTRGVNDTEYDIPLLCEWFKLSQLFKQEIDWSGYPPKSGVSHRLLEYKAEGYWPEGAPPTPKTLRGLYAQRCFQRFGDASTAEWEYVRRVLGHTVDDHSTPLTYMRFKLPSEPFVDGIS